MSVQTPWYAEFMPPDKQECLSCTVELVVFAHTPMSRVLKLVICCRTTPTANTIPGGPSVAGGSSDSDKNARCVLSAV